MAEAAPDAFSVVDGFVEHPWLAPRTIQAREYQLVLARHALERNLLVVLPTGLGKTVVAALVVAESLRRGARGVLMMAPTRPLAQQHVDSLDSVLRDKGIVCLFSGAIPPARRAEQWNRTRVVVATPQTIRNDLDKQRYELDQKDLVLFDEAHHTVGNYAYVEIGQRLAFANPRARVLGLTASPGADPRKLAEVCTNLGVAADGLATMDEADPRVAPYVHRTNIDWVEVELPASIRRIARPIQRVLMERVEVLKALGLVHGHPQWGATKKELVAVTQRLGAALRQGRKDGRVFAGLLAAQVALEAHLTLELVETQGLEPARRHLERLASKKPRKRADASFLAEPAVVDAMALLEKGIEQSHPKMARLNAILLNLLDDVPDATAIVFAQFRDTVETISTALSYAGIACERFVGQGRRGDKGMTQVEQKDVLTRFRDRQFRVLVSTSVGEEGIDVPQVDLVVFYEAVPSEIRAIQRRGRTGRTAAGRVVVLVTKGTRDEAYLHAARGREKKMQELVGGRSQRGPPG